MSEHHFDAIQAQGKRDACQLVVVAPDVEHQRAGAGSPALHQNHALVVVGLAAVKKIRAQFHPRHAVNGGMMNLGHQCKATLRDARNIIQSFDDVEFPKRPAEVHRSRLKSSNLNAQLPPVAGLRQRQMANMIFDIETGVFHPVRMVKIKRDADEFLAKAACFIQAAFDVSQDVFEADETTRCG